MNQILLVYTATKLKRISFYSERDKQMAWNEFKRELKEAASDTYVELMIETEFLKRITL